MSLFQVEINALTPEIYATLRKTVGMKEFDTEYVEKALRNTLFSVVVLENKKPVGIGRVIGDGSVAFFIKDVVVIPEKQGQGIGKLIMVEIMEYIKREGAPNAYVGLMSLKGKEEFYKKFGFHIRPYNNEGNGMTQYLGECGSYHSVKIENEK